MAVKERLESAKAGSTRGIGQESAFAGQQFNPLGRIAKPLRGGGAGIDGPAPVVPTFVNLSAAQNQNLQENGGNKRSSWFFNQRS